MPEDWRMDLLKYNLILRFSSLSEVSSENEIVLDQVEYLFFFFYFTFLLQNLKINIFYNLCDEQAIAF